MTKPLFEIFREAMERKPGASRKEALDYFVAKMKANPVYLEELAVDYFGRMAAAWTVRDEKAGYAFGRKAPVDIQTARKARAAAVERKAAIEARMTAQLRISLLDLTLPNGKTLRHATGADCAKAGGFYAEVAKHLKPTEVVDRHLTEANLQDIRARFFSRNADAPKRARA